jgi:hypothetical protein
MAVELARAILERAGDTPLTEREAEAIRSAELADLFGVELRAKDLEIVKGILRR